MLFSSTECKLRNVAVQATRAGGAKCPPYFAVAFCLLTQSVAAQDVPSGQPVTLQEVLTDTVGSESWLRFRFVAPEISSDSDYAQTEADLTHLCDTTAQIYIKDYDLNGDVIVISLADRLTEFGVAAPDATQFFEAFRVQNGTCILEGL